MEYRLLDTHSHPQFPQYDEDRDSVIGRALSEGIGLVCVGTDLASSRAAMDLAEQYEGLFATVGLHPNDATDEEYSESPFESLLGHQSVVAVGEIGLDFYRTKEEDRQTRQTERFIKQLDMAGRASLPVIIHCRDAHTRMREILRSRPAMNGGVIHSFTGTLDDAREYVELGYLIGFNGIITFARDYDEVVTKLPLENIVLETDAPYLTPVPYRGKRNEPSYVTEVAKKVSKLRGVGLDKVKKVTTSNGLGMFTKIYGGRV